MNDLANRGNLIEAGFWFVVTVLLLIHALRSEPRVRRVLYWLSGAFFVFGVSDLIEAQTGAWWRPLWLLLLKSGCVVVFLLGFREYYRIRKSPDDNHALEPTRTGSSSGREGAGYLALLAAWLRLGSFEMTPKRVFVPPLAPVLLLIGFSAFIVLSEMKAEPRYIDGHVDNAPARAGVLLVMLSPVFYVLCVLVNLGDIFIASLLARKHWLSLILTPILLAGLFTLHLLFRNSDSPGGWADDLLISCFVSVFMVVPIGVWRRLLSRQNAEPGAHQTPWNV